MKHRMKRLLAMLTAFVLVIFLAPLPLTVGAETSGDWEYTVSSGLATITAYNGSDKTVTVPSSFGNYMVTVIGKSAFKNNATMQTLNLPDNLRTIEASAFEGCVGLKSITLPKKLTSLGQCAFKNCTNVKSITVNCESLGDLSYSTSAFYGVGSNTSGISVTFSDSCKSIPAHMFYESGGSNDAPNITSVTMADTITLIGEAAFENCASLKTVKLSSSLMTINDYAFKNCSALTAITFPDTLTQIKNAVFEGCVGLTSITLPQNLVSLGEGTFNNCINVNSITINSKSLGVSYWYNPFCYVGINTSGVSVTFAEGCTQIPARMFYGSEANITSVTMADTVTSIGEAAFENCASLKTVKLSSSLMTINDYAFKNCSALTAITFPDTLTQIKNAVFEGCVGLTSITLPQNLVSLGEGTFNNCINVNSITINSESLGVSYWYNPFCYVGINTSGVSVTFADGCTQIPARMFYKNSSNIISVTIAESVKSIGAAAFDECTTLKEIIFLGNAPEFGSDVFYDVTATAYYPSNGYNWPESKMQDYGGDITWVGYEKDISMYRLYNPNSGEHFYTGNEEERDFLVSLGWKYEGVAWYAPASGDAVYRMYNPNSGDHHYTAYWEEVEMLQSYGWRYEGIGWYSAGETGVPMYRMWNPNADCGSHHYTSSAEERDWLKALGWKYEGIGWYGLDVN